MPVDIAIRREVPGRAVAEVASKWLYEIEAGQEKYVVVDYYGFNVATAPDAEHWTNYSPAARNNWRSVTWGGTTGQQTYVAVASSGTGDRVMTSG